MNYRKLSFWFFLVVGTAVFLIDWIGTEKTCGGGEYVGCMHSLHNVILTLYIFVPAAVFAIATYLFQDHVYQAWLRTARWAILLAVLLVTIAPSYSNDLYLPMEKGIVALACMIAFSIISIMIILRNRNR
jgi:hypothetical protein